MMSMIQPLRRQGDAIAKPLTNKLGKTAVLSKSAIILTLVIILCVIANGFAVVFSTLTHTDELAALRLEKKRLEQRLITLASQPLPKAVTKEELEAISKQVPVQLEYTHVLEDLKEVGRDSGVVVASVQTTERKEYKDPTLPTKAAQPAAQPSTSVSTTTNNAAGAQMNTPDPASTAAKEPAVSAQKASVQPSVMSETLNLQVTGSYLQLIDFIKRLKEMERLIDVTSWGFNASNDKSPAMTMSLRVYWAPGFIDTIPRLLPLPAPEGAKRDNPTVQQEDMK